MSEPYPASFSAWKLNLVREPLPVGIPDAPLFRAEEVASLARTITQSEPREVLLAFCLDSSNRLIGFHTVCTGTLSSCVLHPREVFQPAILSAAAGVIVAHNHPSGDPTPSQADKDSTRRLIGAGEILGIPLVDHVVVTHTDRWVSLRESMVWEGDRRSI